MGRSNPAVVNWAGPGGPDSRCALSFLEERSGFAVATECGNYRVASFPVWKTDVVRSLSCSSRVDLLPALNR